MVEIYVDILILLNFLVDFFMLNLTAKISNSKVKTKRILLSSLLASLFSLYIFLPSQNFAVELLLRVIMTAVTVLCCFGFQNIKMFVKRLILFFIISFLFAGGMVAIWLLFKPNTMAVNNGVVYFNFSPLLFVIITAVLYGGLSLFRILFSKDLPKAKRVKLTAFINNVGVSFVSAVDTGCSLRDPISNSPVIVADKSVLKQLTKENYNLFLNGKPNPLADRFRIIPIKTVGGSSILNAVKCDYLKYNNKLIQNPIIAQSNTNFTEDYSAVINPDILEV